MPVLDKTQLDQTLSLISERLQKAFAPLAIYLFGTYAYGQPRKDSDIDLLVVVPDTSVSAHDRDALAYRALIGIGVPKDVQVYTRSEFESRASLPVSFERTVKSKGILLYAA